ncbi:GNAT family N-acetyltransferase [Undibacterium jejuense]|uniref:GNAT family N-acetyltransferase n=1 Tax=Undibacterium jejuense TaxID=1344949 RepID=A0A923HPC0_9BURK|nr:GNAT family N-acetyltransferase [Undibacterium jejuense]MBC3863241.1 GNAT family N-acetyltransferase [Undibacterium jejuense]
MKIRIDDLHGDEIRALLEEHLQDMYANSPAESVHALDLEALRDPRITFWTIWDENQLAGCIALKQLDTLHAEIKSMRTPRNLRRRGAARQLLQHLIDEARQRNYSRLSLETGSIKFFEPARDLYRSFGFEYCEPFADYAEDPNSVFMSKVIVSIVPIIPISSTSL